MGREVVGCSKVAQVAQDSVRSWI